MQMNAGGDRSRGYQLKVGYEDRRTPVSYYQDLDDGTVWQPDVHRLLRDLARLAACRTVVDLGCGRARKLATLHPEFEVVGVDFGANLEYCRTTYPFGSWREADLERAQMLDLGQHVLTSSAIVCADVIEHLSDPDGLMNTLGTLLEESPFAVLTTPERDLTHGVEHAGPPPNPAHVREWNLDELHRYAVSRGLDVALAGVTASHSVGFERKTSLLLLCGRTISPARRQALAAACEALLGAYEHERFGPGATARQSPGIVSRVPDRQHAGTLPDGVEELPAEWLVSVVMRTKDRPRLLRRAIDSVIGQTWPCWELIVVNDAGAPQPVDDLVQGLHETTRARVRTIHRPQAAGMEAATNAGVAAARGHYLVVLDDDDTWEPELLATGVSHLRANRLTSVRGVVTHANRIVETLHEHGTQVERCEPFTPSLRTVALASLTLGNQFPVNAFVYERSALDAVGPYREDLPVLGDWEFNLRFVRHFDVDVIQRVLANVHLRPAASDGAYSNSPHRSHVTFDVRLRNELLRSDIDSRTPGLGLLMSVVPIVSPMLAQPQPDCRQAYAIAVAELGAVRADVERLTNLLNTQRGEFHRLLLHRMVKRICRARMASVVIVGSGEIGQLASDALLRVGVIVKAVSDNDERRWGMPWQGAPGVCITSVSESLTPAAADAIVIASVAHEGDLRRQVRGICARKGIRLPIYSPGR